MSASRGSSPRRSRRAHHRRAVLAAASLIAVAAILTIAGSHRGQPEPASTPPGSATPPTITATDVPSTTASPPQTGPPLHDPANTNPNWIACKDRLGLGHVSDYQLSNEQETEIVICVVASDITRA